MATALYYFDRENIKDSKLLFRGAYENPKNIQSDAFYCEHYFGLSDEDKFINILGLVEAREDRAVIFLNCFQHHVDASALEDASKLGHRKTLCFFLVDPYNDYVMSTKVVPPQQES